MSDKPSTSETPETPTPESPGGKPIEAPVSSQGEVSGTTPPEPAEATAGTGSAARLAGGASTAAEAAPSPAAAPKLGPKGAGYHWGTGRRKASVARVRLRPGSGKFLIRDRSIDAYFFDLRHRNDVVAALKATSTFGKFDILVNVHGGGQTGQAGAISLGVARALLKADPSLEAALRSGKFLTRDSRKVERKKPGQPGARKRFQFSKR